MAESIVDRLNQTTVRKSLRYRLVLLGLKKTILSNRPRSVFELAKRIEEYLRLHPKAATIIGDAGISIQHLASKLSSYAK